jgi:CMP-N-acetylneuraminic acid synthetase
MVEPLLALLLSERKWATHVVMLNPTSPFRDPHTIIRCMGAIERKGYESCATASKTRLPAYLWRREEDVWKHPFGEGAWPRSQDVEPGLVLHGACFVASRRMVEAGRLCDRDTRPIITDDMQAIDIDTDVDLAMARGVWDVFVAGQGVV